MVFESVDHEIRNVGTRDTETEGRQVSDCYPILAGGRFVSQLRWAYQRPIEPALGDDAFHFAGVAYDSGEKQAAEKVGRRENRILEEKSG